MRSACIKIYVLLRPFLIQPNSPRLCWDLHYSVVHLTIRGRQHATGFTVVQIVAVQQPRPRPWQSCATKYMTVVLCLCFRNAAETSCLTCMHVKHEVTNRSSSLTTWYIICRSICVSFLFHCCGWYRCNSNWTTVELSGERRLDRPFRRRLQSKPKRQQ